MKHDDFVKYLAELRSLPPEVPLEPELKPQRIKLDRRIREEQALAAGAVLSAVLEKGERGPSPKEGDLVYIHYSIRDTQDELLFSTRSEEGGAGQAFAFLLEKGVRVPRGWEIAIRDMTRGQRSVLQVQPGFGFRHPECGMRPPACRGLRTDQVLRFDLTLLDWYPAASVHAYGSSSSSSDSTLLKRSIREGSSWESPRPPFEVTLHLTACCPAYDGRQLTGQRLFSSRGRQPLTLQLGRGLLPQGVEDALSYMSKGELAAFVVPASSMRPDTAGGRGRGTAREGKGGAAAAGEAGPRDRWDEEESSSSEDDEDEEEEEEEGGVQGRTGSHGAASGSGRGGGGGGGGSSSSPTPSCCLVPPAPPRCQQVELEVELLGMVQVRDMTGTGEVTKKRVREGSGEFPIDCPLHDTTVRMHYKARPARPMGLQLPAAEAAAQADGGGGGGEGGQGGGEGEGDDGGWVYDSRRVQSEPLMVDTGCGELPEAVEMALKLMVPGEVARVLAAPRYAYAGRPAEECPVGRLPGGAAVEWQGAEVEFEVELLDFEREGHWQNLTFEERYTLAERLKAKGNELFRKQQFKHAKARYDRLLRLLESTRDYEEQQQVERIEAYKVAALGNMALCAVQMGEFAAAVAACDKALEYEPENAKMFFRKGRALSLKGDYEEAAEALKLALEYDPSSEKDINAELAANAERHKAAVRKQKRDLGNFLKAGKR
ncbi:hypothetical protein Agub_g15164 [Astrephomene gubernaculifera]|uniref:peptidylprolyl isomerase n=1 Tax=Astrephomene gubernaculifera TaxID=47775 RepID=A0AAD3E4N5_9CHLO|nr:hypothetical protein Agub_g15164 [Astrephomene gubernaculifera]